MQPISTLPTEPGAARGALRKHLHEGRDRFAASDAAASAAAALASNLSRVLAELGPERLGLYWSVRSEFNAAAACLADTQLDELPFALPYSRRTPLAMEYRPWDRRAPALRDECGIASVAGAALVPDVVLAPCLGFTRAGYRIGYGGGYFDRWLALHPHVTALGVAWGVSEVEADRFMPGPHDIALTLIVTEHAIVGG